MTPRRVSRSCACLSLAVLLLSGCSDYTNQKPPTTYKVRGKVVWANGQPLSGGQITFHPVQSASSEASAEIEKDGTFALSTFGKNDGAMPGNYRISLDPYSYKTGQPKLVAAVPRQYLDPRTSGLTAEVKEGETNLTPIQIR